MSTTTIESSPVYRDCIVEGIVCITCNGTVPVSALGLKKHEMKCHTKWYQMQYQKASDLNRRQGIVADFKNAVINILKTLFANIYNMKLETLKHIDNEAREYVYCSALECRTLIVNKYCHKGNRHYSKYIEGCKKGYTSKYLRNHNHGKVVPVNFSFHKIEEVKDIFHPFFISAFKKVHIDNGGMELPIMVNGDGFSNDLSTGKNICKMKRDIVSMYAATVVKPFDIGPPPKKQARHAAKTLYRNKREHGIKIQPDLFKEFWNALPQCYPIQVCAEVRIKIQKKYTKRRRTCTKQ